MRSTSEGTPGDIWKIIVTDNEDTFRGGDNVIKVHQKRDLIVVSHIGGNIDYAHSYRLSYIDPYSDHFKI